MGLTPDNMGDMNEITPTMNEVAASIRGTPLSPVPGVSFTAVYQGGNADDADFVMVTAPLPGGDFRTFALVGQTMLVGQNLLNFMYAYFDRDEDKVELFVKRYIEMAANAMDHDATSFCFSVKCDEEGWRSFRAADMRDAPTPASIIKQNQKQKSRFDPSLN